MSKRRRSQTVFREVNDRIAELPGSFMDGGVKLFVCECSRESCAEALEITFDEYEAVRRHNGRYLLARGHQVDELERVVDEGARYVVVEPLGRLRQATAASHTPRLRVATRSNRSGS